MELEELQTLVKEFCEERDWDQFHTPKDLAIGLSTESNELLDLFRFKSEEQIAAMLGSEKYRERISEELADVFFFLLRFSQRFGFDMKQGLLDKVRKNGEKYPVDRAKGSNLKYNEYEDE